MSDKMRIRNIEISSEDPDQLCSFYEKTFRVRVFWRNSRGNAAMADRTESYILGFWGYRSIRSTRSLPSITVEPR
jgi:hypothetical protein